MVLYLTEGLTTESVTSSDVSSALRNREAILITYDDETSKAQRGIRYIEPYVLGLTKAGNPCIRAYQYWGSTRRGVPKWKMFRLDRIMSWKPTGETFELEPQARGWAAEAYNNNGDNSMSQVYMTVDLQDYEQMSDYEKLKAKTRQLQNGKRLNINQLNPNAQVSRKQSVIQQQPKKQGPIKNDNNDEAENVVKQNSPTNMDTKDNTQDSVTQKPSIQEPTPKQDGPIVDKEQTQTQGIKQVSNPTVNSDKPMTDDDFRKMLQRNLEITRQERERRNQRKFGNQK